MIINKGSLLQKCDKLPLFFYILLFTNLTFDTPFRNTGLLVMGVFIEIGSSPTRFLKYFLKSKLFIAIKFLIRHIYKDIQKIVIVQMN